MGTFKEMKEGEMPSSVHTVRETAPSTCLCTRSGTEKEWEAPSHHMVGHGLPWGWVNDVQIVDPPCRPQDTWFSAISIPLLWKFGRRVQESGVFCFFMLVVMVTMMVTMILGCHGPLGQSC